MTRIHGKSGVAYLSLNSGDPASPVAFLSSWTVEYTQEYINVTGILDSQSIYIAVITSSAGTFAGFYDTATAQSYVAAADGLPRNFYLYPGGSGGGAFFSGTVLPDYNITGGGDAAVSLAVSWSAAGAVTRTGSGAAPAGLASAAGAALRPSVTVPGGKFTSVPGVAVPGLFRPGSTS